jgi:hypothetical protein
MTSAAAAAFEAELAPLARTAESSTSPPSPTRGTRARREARERRVDCRALAMVTCLVGLGVVVASFGCTPQTRGLCWRYVAFDAAVTAYVPSAPYACLACPSSHTSQDPNCASMTCYTLHTVLSGTGVSCTVSVSDVLNLTQAQETWPMYSTAVVVAKLGADAAAGTACETSNSPAYTLVAVGLALGVAGAALGALAVLGLCCAWLRRRATRMTRA